MRSCACDTASRLCVSDRALLLQFRIRLAPASPDLSHLVGAFTKWKIPSYTNAHALALDEASHLLFPASLQPGRLTVVDTQSGQVVVALPCNP